MNKKAEPMGMAVPTKQNTFTFVVAPSRTPTTIRIAIESYCGDEPAEIRLFLGDRLVPPNKLCFAGKEYELAPNEWTLLYVLSTRIEKRLSLKGVERAIWTGNNRTNVGQLLAALISKLNKKLLAIDYPATVRRKAGFVILD